MSERFKNKWLNCFAGKQFNLEIDAEMMEGLNKFGKFNSNHELYAVIKEELEEFWESVKKMTLTQKNYYKYVL